MISNLVIDNALIKTICKLYGNSKDYVTMKYIAIKFGLTKNNIISIIKYAITNNIISDELTQKIILKVTRRSGNSPYIVNIYDDYLQMRKQNKDKKLDVYYSSLQKKLAYIEYTLEIFDSVFSDSDDFYQSKDSLEFELIRLKKDISNYEYYLFSVYFKAPSI